MTDLFESESVENGLVGCLRPISAQSPCGVDARLEPEHELLRSEIAKLSAIDGTSPDWAVVESVSKALLAHRSKDLLVAAYLSCAWMMRDGQRGAVHGASLLTTLLSTFGNAVFPQRPRARISALAWYLEWLVQQLDHGEPASPAEAQGLREQLHRLRAAAHEVLGEEAPSFVSVLRQCERIALTASAAQQSAPVPVSPPVQAPKQKDSLAVVPAAASGAAPVVTIAATAKSVLSIGPAADTRVFGPPPGGLPELQTYVARTGSLLVDLARSRFLTDRTDGRAYRWLRTGVWLRWERAPAPSRRGRTDLDGPSAARYAELTRARDAERWDDLLALSEQQLIKHPLWLDLNRFSALALERLGETFAVARAHVLRETQALLARLPELTTLCFSDGAPFAASDTVKWLAPPVPVAVAPAASAALEPSLRERLQQNEAGAVAEVERRLRSDNSLRASFLLRLELASALEHNGQQQRAACVYLGLERDIDTHQLERWEPELALRVLHALWRLLSTREGAAASEVDRLSVRLSQLAPTLLL